MRIALLITILLFAVLLLAQNNSYVPDPHWKAPAKAAEARNPLKGASEAVQHGRELFASQCSMCHGSDGQGLANAADFHLRSVRAQSDGSLFWKITNGNQQKGMPAFSGLDDHDRWSLVSYLRTFKPKKK